MKTWPTKKLSEVLGYEQPTKYLVGSTDYKDEYMIPVLTAGKSFVLGNTNEESGIFPKEKLPVIIFDDFTTAIKFVDFPFKVKSSAMKILHAKKDVADISFLFYKMQTIKFGHDQHKRYWISEYSNLEISLPPLETQKQIVERLDKIAESQKLNDELIQKADELFQSLLHKELDPAGKDWEIKKIKDIAGVGNGGTPSTKNPKYWNGKILWLTPKELSGFEDIEIFDTERKISNEGLSHSSATLLPVGTVLFTSRAPIGYIAIAGVTMTTNQGFKNFVCDSKQLNNKFLYFFLRLKKKYLQSLGRGATFTEISKTIVEKVEISLPSLKIQKQIVAKLSAAQDYKTQLLAQKSKLKELFSSVLSKSFNA
ncbi:MAG: restriction endonuclease subunit S [Patescibacteria group bacterium]|nr:restriction endonuclease subunit S [Patescibacteria group bacterium]